MGVALADVTEDGKADIVAANTDSDTVSVLANQGDGTFAAQVTHAVGHSLWRSLGRRHWGWEADIVAANGGGDTVSILVNQGDQPSQPQ